MNEEILLSHIVGIRMIFLAFIVWFYTRAGRGDGSGGSWKILGVKVRRRIWLPIMTSLCLTIVMLLTKQSSWLLFGAIWATVGVYFGSMSLLGYGAGSILRKLGKVPQRIIVHAGHAASPILIVLVTGLWEVYILGIIISALVGTVLGVRNPLPAANEEGAIGLAEFAYAQFLV